MLWNAMYNGMVVLPILEGATIVCFDNNLAIVFAANHKENVGVYTTETVTAVDTCFRKSGLALDREKTEAILIENRKKENTVKVKIRWSQNRLLNT